MVRAFDHVSRRMNLCSPQVITASLMPTWHQCTTATRAAGDGLGYFNFIFPYCEHDAIFEGDEPTLLSSSSDIIATLILHGADAPLLPALQVTAYVRGEPHWTRHSPLAGALHTAIRLPSVHIRRRHVPAVSTAACLLQMVMTHCSIAGKQGVGRSQRHGSARAGRAHCHPLPPPSPLFLSLLLQQARM